VLPASTPFGLGIDHLGPALAFHVVLGFTIGLGSLDLGSLGFDALVPESPSLSVHLVSP
jgi:hypothetical protein